MSADKTSAERAEKRRTVDPALQFFTFAHLKPAQREVSRPFCELAAAVVEELPDNPQRKQCLDYLMIAKDCAVRASLYQPGWTGEKSP